MVRGIRIKIDRYRIFLNNCKRHKDWKKLTSFLSNKNHEVSVFNWEKLWYDAAYKPTCRAPIRRNLGTMKVSKCSKHQTRLIKNDQNVQRTVTMKSE